MSKADIEIGNKRYSVVCAPGQEARLTKLGSRLDKRVEKIRDAVGDVGEARLLLISALALMDELDAARLKSQAPPEVITDANAALLDAAARIDAIATRIETAK